MGFAGKVEERERARELRAQSWTLQEIADELGVSKSSASVWTRDVDFEPRPRNRGHSTHKPHPLTVKKHAQLEQCRRDGIEQIGHVSSRDLRLYALGLYAGEGGKARGCVSFANTNPAFITVFLAWLREEFDIDERRLRGKLYLHQGLDLAAATEHWSTVTGIPEIQFVKPYRPIARGAFRTSKHVFGCFTVRYSCTLTHARLMAMISAVSSSVANPG